MKKLTSILTASLTAAVMLAPMPANALYRETGLEEFENSKECSGLTAVEDCGLFGADKLYANNDGTKFIALERLKKDVLVFTLSDSSDIDEISGMLKEKFGEDLFIRSEDFFGDIDSSFAVDNLEKDDLKTKAEMCNFLKEQNLITDCRLITERYSVHEWYGVGLNYYLSWYIETNDNGEPVPGEDGVFTREDNKDTFAYLSEYAKENLEGYSVRKYDKTDSEGKVTDTLVELVAPENADISEQVKTAAKIRKDTHLMPSYCSPESVQNDLGSSIDIFNAVKGDSNCDGSATVADAVAILQSIGNNDKYPLSAQGRFNGDLVGGYDGITANDALEIQKIDSQKNI